MNYELWIMNVSTEDEIMITILNRTENSSFIIHHSSFYFPLQYFLNAIFSEARIGLRSGLMTKQLYAHLNIFSNVKLKSLSISIFPAIKFYFFCYQYWASGNISWVYSSTKVTSGNLRQTGCYRLAGSFFVSFLRSKKEKRPAAGDRKNCLCIV
jgi:hypothetical protein